MDNITKEEFESFVPAFRSPTGEVFAKMQDSIETLAADWDSAVKEGAAVATATAKQIKRAVALRAAYLTVPELDLVLTPTGFGIVSNQNTAPASRERVDSLREELRRSASDAEDSALQALLSARQLSRPEAEVHSLLWIPTLMRLYGVTAADGKPVYSEEAVALRADLRTAEAHVAGLISPELLEALRAGLYADSEPSAVRAVAIEYTRRLLAAYLPPSSGHHGTKALSRILLGYIRANVDFFPEYTSSQTYAAHEFQQYENQKEDTTFFFG